MSELWDDDIPLRQIATRLGLTANQVAGWLYRNNEFKRKGPNTLGRLKAINDQMDELLRELSPRPSHFVKGDKAEAALNAAVAAKSRFASLTFEPVEDLP